MPITTEMRETAYRDGYDAWRAGDSVTCCIYSHPLLIDEWLAGYHHAAAFCGALR